MDKNSFFLYIIEDLDYSQVIAKYRELCLEGDVETPDPVDDILGEDGKKNEVISLQPLRIIKAPRKPTSNSTIIENKIKFIIHSIAFRQHEYKDYKVDITLKMDILKKVIGRDAKELVEALVAKGYMTKSSHYIIGKEARTYRTKGHIKSIICKNEAIKKYIDKAKEIVKEETLERLNSPSFIKDYGIKFYETYTKNLRKFHIRDEDGLKKYISTAIEHYNEEKNKEIKELRLKNTRFSNHKANNLENYDIELYYKNLYKTLKEKYHINSIDSNHRIYHTLTNLEREVKHFLNIKFSIDCSNSHPLLFNYFIGIDKLKSISTLYHISFILSKIPKSSIIKENEEESYTYKYHYDVNFLRNELENSGINSSILAKFQDDELLYLWKTTTGNFWDDMLEAHKDSGLDRSEIKVKMFAEVFYSHTKGTKWKEFGKEFEKQYPHVYKLITWWKDPVNYPQANKLLKRRGRLHELYNATFLDFEAETALPNIMMEFESVIFRDILKSLFRKRIACVHIHDAIVVPETKSTENIKPEQIIKVMTEVYQKFGLCPNFKVETY